MQTFTLTDVAHDLWIESFAIGARELGLPSEFPWSVSKRMLRGGRRDRVDLIEVRNGPLSFSVVPTRGMGIWKAQCQGDPVGWDSPITDGPVHPAFVNLMAGGGLGWLDGFDELLARCGLESNGAPYGETSAGPDGSVRHTTTGLHGKIANLPARFVAVHLETEPPYTITVEGHVEETRLFGTQIRMITRIATVPGSNRITVRDEFLNLKRSPGAMQILYHWNFGPPHLEAGSEFVAPIKALAPRDPRARDGLDGFSAYEAPTPGFAEQAYFLELHGESPGGRTLAMLRNRARDRAVVLRFSGDQLPAFTLWKCTGDPSEGYVTGLEPATNYPNPRPFEAARGRVVDLPGGGRYLTEMTLDVLNTREAVAAVASEIDALQKRAAPVVHPGPIAALTPGA